MSIEGKMGFGFDFRYRVVKLWEEDPAPILSMANPGLCVFAPLMAGNPMELVLQSRERIRRAPDSLATPEEKRELLTILGGISALVIEDRKLLAQLFSEIRMTKDNYFFNLIRKEGEAVGLAKGIEQGKAEGRKEGLRLAIRTALERRFGKLPPIVVRGLRKVEDSARLESLLAEAVACEDVDSFLRSLS